MLPSTSLNAKRRLAESITVKPSFFAFPFLWLHRPTRPATLLSSLVVINEHVLHGGRGMIKLLLVFWHNLFLYAGSFPPNLILETYWIPRLLIKEARGLPTQ